MTPDLRSLAVVAYLDHGRPPFSGGAAAVRAACGSADAAHLVVEVEQLLHGLPADPASSPTSSTADSWEGLRHAVQQAREQVADQHPDLSAEALDALSSYLAWSWK